MGPPTTCIAGYSPLSRFPLGPGSPPLKPCLAYVPFIPLSPRILSLCPASVDSWVCTTTAIHQTCLTVLGQLGRKETETSLPVTQGRGSNSRTPRCNPVSTLGGIGVKAQSQAQLQIHPVPRQGGGCCPSGGVGACRGRLQDGEAKSGAQAGGVSLVPR